MKDTRSVLYLAILCLFVYILKTYSFRDSDTPAYSNAMFVEIAEHDEFPIVYGFEHNAELGSIPGWSSISPNLKNGDRIIKDNANIELSRMSGLKSLALNIPIAINKASIQDLEALPGIGPALAKRIIEYRMLNDGFKTTEELQQVKGIGEKKVKSLMPLISLD